MFSVHKEDIGLFALDEIAIRKKKDILVGDMFSIRQNI